MSSAGQPHTARLSVKKAASATLTFLLGPVLLGVVVAVLLLSRVVRLGLQVLLALLDDLPLLLRLLLGHHHRLLVALGGVVKKMRQSGRCCMSILNLIYKKKKEEGGRF